MKPLISKTLIFLLAVLLSGCAQKDPAESSDLSPNGPQSEDPFAHWQPHESEYTILFYGAGGGNLDAYMLSALQDAARAGSDSLVQMAFQMKISFPYQCYGTNPDFDGTSRFVITGSRDADGYVRHRFADYSYDMGKASSLSGFIGWATRVCPARKYILVLWGHGNGWTPQTRAIVMDDNTGTFLNLDSLVEGLRAGGLELELLYLDSCAMGMMEVLTPLDGLARCVLTSAGELSGCSGSMASLAECLRQFAQTDRALEAYIGQRMALDSQNPDPSALSLVRMEGLRNLVGIMADLSDTLCAAYSHDRPAIDRAIASTLRYIVDDGFYPLDVRSLLIRLVQESDNTAYQALLDRLEAFRKDSFFSIGNQAMVESGLDFFLSVSLMDSSSYHRWSYDTAYGLLDFDIRTHWSRFLELNGQSTDGNPFVRNELQD